MRRHVRIVNRCTNEVPQIATLQCEVYRNVHHCTLKAQKLPALSLSVISQAMHTIWPQVSYPATTCCYQLLALVCYDTHEWPEMHSSHWAVIWSSSCASRCDANWGSSKRHTIREPSPMYFCTSSDPDTRMKVQSVWCATARANSVLPVPGGPCKRTPLGCATPNASKSSGCLIGNSITCNRK